MISAAHRFHGHNSLNYVYRNGQIIRGPLTSLKFAPNARRSEYRLAIVVSKKVSKSAVVRNRIRRRLYEAARTYEPLIKQPYDMVITVFSDAVTTISAKEVDTLVRVQMRQAGIIGE